MCVCVCPTKTKLQKNEYPYSNLSTLGPSFMEQNLPPFNKQKEHDDGLSSRRVIGIHG